MQLCALNEQKSILAREAQKGIDYQCPECLSVVRVRGGFRRQRHFFHLQTQSSCRQHQKGPIHIHLQLYISALLPEGRIERAFPEIGRIADVVCEKSRRVFEVQFSPISAEEVIARSLAYESLGYQMVWIFHDKRFNKRFLKSAELALGERCVYFSNMNAKGEGFVYDQLEQREGARRLKKSAPLPVDLKTFYPFSQSQGVALSRQWPLYHGGDLISRLLEGQLSLPQKVERARRGRFSAFYRACLHLLLESVSGH